MNIHSIKWEPLMLQSGCWSLGCNMVKIIFNVVIMVYTVMNPNMYMAKTSTIKSTKTNIFYFQ